MYPSTRPTIETQKSPKAGTLGKQDKPESKSPPKHWSEINVGHLVLAKSDGPWRDYWEAVAIELSSDLVRLRWRDESDLAPISRSRFDLALICPEAT